MSAAKHSFTKEQIAEYKSAFDEADADRSGKIDASELRAVMEKCGVETTDAQIKDMFKEVAGAATELDFEDFLALMWKMQSGPSEKEIRNEMFTMLDDNMDGLVNFEELKSLFKKASADTKGVIEIPSDDIIRQMLSEAAADGSQMTFDDLNKLLDQV